MTRAGKAAMSLWQKIVAEEQAQKKLLLGASRPTRAQFRLFERETMIAGADRDGHDGFAARTARYQRQRRRFITLLVQLDQATQDGL